MFTLKALLLLALLGGLVSPTHGQDRRKDPPAGTATVRKGKPVPRSRVRVSVKVTGLRSNHSLAALEAVRAIRHEVYTCTSCKALARQPGACTVCSKPLEASGHTSVILEAELGVANNSLTMTVATHHWIGLDQLDAALKPHGASIKRQSFRIPVRARVAVTGMPMDKASRLRGTLLGLKVYRSLNIMPDADGVRMWVIPGDEGSTVTLGEIQAALDLLGQTEPKIVVTNVQWAAFCTHCGTRPLMESGNPTCRGE